MRIRCTTKFDITATGVKSNFNKNRIPFRDTTGRDITNESQWHRSRNQQRNWETLIQLLTLRTLISDITDPQKDNNSHWFFEFEIENPAELGLEGERLILLEKDCELVPMLTGLDENCDVGAYLEPGRNIFFVIVSDK